MSDQPWLNSVRRRLARQALPSAYAERFMEELGDHLDDLREESEQIDPSSRLGQPEEVAAAAVITYRRRSFIGRHPLAAFLVFAVSPVVLQYVLFILFAFVVALLSGQIEQNWAFSVIFAASSACAGILYGGFATRLGLGRKWARASCAVLGVMAMLYEAAVGLGGAGMLLAQLVAPLGFAWSFGRLNRGKRLATAAFFVFAITPVAAYTVLFTAAALLMVRAQPVFSGFGEFVAAHFGSAVVTAWEFVPVLLLFLVPSAAASLAYCRFARRFDSGRTWMLVSCMVLAAAAAAQSLRVFLAGYETAERYSCPPLGLMASVILVQFLPPLAIGWWFMRRKHLQGRLEVAS